MACRQSGSIRSVLRSTSGGLLALALFAAPGAASAAKLSQVRVGTHESHTRIVLELDEAASYRLAPPGAGGSQLQIQLDAESAARHVSSKSPLVRAVRVEPSQRGSTISVDLTKGDVEISEMVLANPPRIVLDVKPAGSMAAMAAAQKLVAAPKPAAAPTSEGRLAADGRPVTDAAEVKPVAPSAAVPSSSGTAPSLADPVPSDIVAKPAARFAAPKAPPLEPAPATQAAAPAKAESVNPEIAAKAEPKPEAAPPAEQKAADPGAEAAAPAAEEAPVRVAPAPAPKPAEVVVRRPTPPATAKPVVATATSWTDRLTSPLGYAAVGAVLLLLVVLAVRRRRRDEDDDPLYSVMAADDAGADADDLRGQQHDDPVVEWGRRDEEPGERPAYAGAGFDADEPVAGDGSQQLALGRAHAPELEEPAPAATESDPDAMFDGPGAPVIATPPAVVAPSDAYAGGDATRIAGEFEGRIKDLERRIEQLAEARERLERQVAAQTEELRVQRAAIARTQRVVRSMSKGEDLATEPVPRAPQV